MPPSSCSSASTSMSGSSCQERVAADFFLAVRFTLVASSIPASTHTFSRDESECGVWKHMRRLPRVFVPLLLFRAPLAPDKAQGGVHNVLSSRRVFRPPPRRRDAAVVDRLATSSSCVASRHRGRDDESG